MTFGKDEDGTKKKMPLSIMIGFCLLMLVGAGFYLQYKQHHAIIAELKSQIHTQQVAELPHDFNHVDADILEWAYKRAHPYVPKSHVANTLYFAQTLNNYLMIVALVAEESAYDTYAKSSKNARGLAQIMWPVWGETLKKHGVLKEKIDLYDAQYAIPACDFILKQYKEEFGDWNTVLMRYVNGDKDYVLRVLSNYAELTLIVNDRNNKGAISHEPNPSNNNG